MSKTWVLTLAYMNFEVIDSSLRAYYATADKVGEHIILDNLWPIDSHHTSQSILRLAYDYNAKVMRPYENLGGARSLNWTMSNLPIKDDDLILTFDCDSNPVTPHWDTILTSAMQDPAYAYLSLRLDMEGLATQEWEEDVTVNGHPIIRPAHGHAEMVNVTCWRFSFLRDAGGFRGLPYYGGIELPLHALAKQKGMKTGYVRDASERFQEAQRDPRYQAWKQAHVSGQFLENFDRWLARA